MLPGVRISPSRLLIFTINFAYNTCDYMCLH